MSVDSFQKLREIDSLTKMRIKHLTSIKEQDDRLSKLRGKLQEAFDQSAQVKRSIVAQELSLQEIEAQIKRAATQKQNLVDIGGDENKIRTFQQEIEHWEEKGFEAFEEIEKLQTELSDSQSFATGLAKTITEIETEVRSENDKSAQEVSILNQRIEALKTELPADFLRSLDKVSAKNLAHGPFTRVDQGSCFFCRYKISRIDESEIDMQKTLKTCPQCSRIFLPYGA